MFTSLSHIISVQVLPFVFSVLRKRIWYWKLSSVSLLNNIKIFSVEIFISKIKFLDNSNNKRVVNISIKGALKIYN